jgi:hypothetical protein
MALLPERSVSDPIAMPGIELPVMHLLEWHARGDAHKPNEKATVEIKSKSSKKIAMIAATRNTPRVGCVSAWNKAPFSG